MAACRSAGAAARSSASAVPSGSTFPGPRAGWEGTFCARMTCSLGTWLGGGLCASSSSMNGPPTPWPNVAALGSHERTPAPADSAVARSAQREALVHHTRGGRVRRNDASAEYGEEGPHR